MRHTLRVLGSLGAMVAAPALYGQAAEGSVSVGRSIFTNKSLGELGLQQGVRETLRVGDGMRVTARLNINSWRLFGHEVGYGYDRSSIRLGVDKVGMSVHQGFYDMLLHGLPEGSTIRPFLCAGVGFSSFFPPGASVSYGNGVTKFGYNYGAGVKVRTGPMYGFRLDVRDYVTGKPFKDQFGLQNVRGMLHNLEVSAGFAVFF